MIDESNRYMEVAVDEGKSYVVGRNGTFALTALQVSMWSPGIVHLVGIGKRGKPVRGGMRVAPAEAMDQICRRWLEERGRWPGTGDKAGLAGKVTVTILQTEVPEDEMALLINGDHVATSDSGTRIENVEQFLQGIGEALGVEFGTIEWVYIDEEEMGVHLPREWSKAAELWLSGRLLDGSS